MITECVEAFTLTLELLYENMTPEEIDYHETPSIIKKYGDTFILALDKQVSETFMTKFDQSVVDQGRHLVFSTITYFLLENTKKIVRLRRSSTRRVAFRA